MERGKRDQRRGERVTEPISEGSIFRPGSLQSPHLCESSKKSKSSVSAALRVILKPLASALAGSWANVIQ